MSLYPSHMIDVGRWEIIKEKLWDHLLRLLGRSRFWAKAGGATTTQKTCATVQRVGRPLSHALWANIAPQARHFKWGLLSYHGGCTREFGACVEGQRASYGTRADPAGGGVVTVAA